MERVTSRFLPEGWSVDTEWMDQNPSLSGGASAARAEPSRRMMGAGKKEIRFINSDYIALFPGLSWRWCAKGALILAAVLSLATLFRLNHPIL